MEEGESSRPFRGPVHSLLKMAVREAVCLARQGCRKTAIFLIRFLTLLL